MPKATNSNLTKQVELRFNPIVPSESKLVEEVIEKKFKLPISIVGKKSTSTTSISISRILCNSPDDYPTKEDARMNYKSPETNKALTSHQFLVYDWILNIPVGKVSTYGIIAKAIGSSAQAVGGALKCNPFQPYIPCHRVIASTLYIGGFQGEWIKELKTQSSKKSTAKVVKLEGEGERVNRKLELLQSEGVSFDSNGYLTDKGMIWEG